MRILLVTSRYPLPSWRGNQVRTMEWLDALSEHDLALVCPEPDVGPSGGVGAAVHSYDRGLWSKMKGLGASAISRRPLQEGLYDCPRSRRAVTAALVACRPDVVIVQMVRCAWVADLVTEFAPGVPLVFDSIDAMGLHFERAAESAWWPLSAAYRLEAARCRRREKTLANDARLTVAVSRRDLDALEPPPGRGRVLPVAGREVDDERSGPEEPVVLLSGNLGYRPTVAGAEWFAKKVWPQVHTRVPASRWVLAGARPAKRIQDLERLPGVEVFADVPDLGVYLRSARMAIAPMSSGSGVPMKVLEAMAAAVPAVVHPWAADGLVEGAEGVVSVATGVEEWVEITVKLLTEADTARELGQKGRAMWSRYYSPRVVADGIRMLVGEAFESQ